MDKGWLLELVALFGSENQALDVRSSAFLWTDCIMGKILKKVEIGKFITTALKAS